MQDKNGVEIKTGDIVEVSHAYFDSDKGLYFVEHSPGDPTWSGSDHALIRVSKRGKVSTAKGRICFWPISVFVNDRSLRYKANDWNKQHAEIEVLAPLPNMAGVADYFREEAAHYDAEADRLTRIFGGDNDTVRTQRGRAEWYRQVVLPRVEK